MTTKVKRIREQQSLSISFIADKLDLSVEEYKCIESESFSSLNGHVQSLLTKLFGVDYEDLEDTRSKETYSDKELGLARIYNAVSDKDEKEIKRLLNYKKMDMRRRVYEKNIN